MESGSNKELDWEEYEAITKYIYETLGAEYGIKVVGYGRDNKVVGRSGVKHQLDVLTEQIEGEGVHLTAIECKFLKKKVTKDTVMKLRSVMDDANISNGIIVCKKGFTRDTLTYAEHVGIKLVELWESEKEDVNLGILKSFIKCTVTRINIVSIDLGSIRITNENEIMSIRCGNYASIITWDGKEIPFRNYVDAYCDEVNRLGGLLNTVTVNYPPVKGKLVGVYTDKQPEVEKISISGFRFKMDKSSHHSFEIIDQVHMIMKEIFENEGYKLLKSGILLKDINES